jgi:hypothetical protein
MRSGKRRKIVWPEFKFPPINLWTIGVYRPQKVRPK